MTTKRAVPVFVAAIALLTIHLSCGGKSSSKKMIGPNATKASPGTIRVSNGKTPKGLTIELSDGNHSAGSFSRAKPANVSVLNAGATQNLLSRLSAVRAKSTDTKKFHLRGKSLPPPRTGRTIKTAFPAAGSNAPPVVKTDKGPLKVLRFAPEGDVPLAPHLSITFSQPMIAVSSHANTTAKGVPVKLTPQPKGKWRWIGTRTLLFDPAVRFPQSTQYKVEIPAGTKSANGNVLASAKHWTFTTPAPRIKIAHPKKGPHHLDPVMFISFDQKIDPAAVLAKISVRTKSQTFKVRMATAAEIKDDKVVSRLVKMADKSHHKSRYLSFRAVTDLPKDANIVIEVGAGTPSQEGPRKTARAQSYTFRTYPPLRVKRYRCGWRNNCPPGRQWYVSFNNPLDHQAFDAATIKVAPALPRYRAHISHSNLYIRGSSKARTSYAVTLPAALTDKFGQNLGADKELMFQVGSARPFLRGRSGLTVADPAAKKPTYSVFSVNIDKLQVKVWKVSPSDWWAYTKYMRKNWRNINTKTPPGKLVVDTSISTNSRADEVAETNVDLKPALTGKYGHAIVQIQPATWHRKRKPVLRAWVQVTKLGLDAFADDTELIGWVTKLADGSPLSGVKLHVSPSGNRASSDGKGLANIQLTKRANRTDKDRKSTVQMLIARKGDDVAFLPEHSYVWSDHGTWYEKTRSEQLRWFVFDDRKMYKPGEELNIKGWLRRIDMSEGGDTNALAGAVKRVNYTVHGARGNKLGKGSARVNAIGGFHAKFKLPKNANLGHASVRFTAASAGGLANTGHSLRFRIQEFRRPEYEVTVKAGQGPYLVGTNTNVTVKAKYFAGGGLANAKVNWQVTANTGTFRPPNRKGFVFGEWVPWWRHNGKTGATSFHKNGKTDATGSHILNMDFVSMNPPRPMNVQVRGSVQDVNRQNWSGRTSLLVHPSDYYVGLKAERMFVEKGDPIEVKAIVVDHDGKAIIGRKVKMQAVRMEWVYENGKYTNKKKDPQDCALTSATKAKVCAFPTKEGGVYYITATISDNKGRPNETKITTWVSGGKVVPARNVSRQKVELIPNKKEYQPGDTAEILVRAPFFPAHALMTIRRSGIVSTKRFKLEKSTTTLKIPIQAAYLPNVFVHVDLVGAAERTNDKGKADPSLPKRPAFASGAIKLSIPPKQRTLTVDVKPAVKKLAPGGKTHLDIVVRDAKGEPVSGAEVAVVVVDESVLSLTGYRLPKALAAFYPQRSANSRDVHMRGHITLANPDQTKAPGGVGGGGSKNGALKMDEEKSADNDDGSAPPPPSPARSRRMGKGRAKNKPASTRPNSQPAIAVRIDFSALALFSPEVATDAKGAARVAIKLPDNLTRYRIMAVAVDSGRRFGNGESSVTARKPLMVRPSAPRFLNFGDTFELPVVLQNQTDADLQVQVAARATNATLTKASGYSLLIPANDRVEVRFPAAAQMPGTARFQIATSSGSFSDAAEFSLPVWTPATTEAFATYGVVTKGAMRQPVAMPKNVVKEFGGLEITTSSTQLQALTDAVIYLVNYPYECTEQMSSRVLAISSLRDVLGAFKAKGLPSSNKVEAAVRRDIKMLSRLQNYDGGFAFWRRGDRSWPYISVFVAHALTTAKAKGYKVPESTLSKSKQYLQKIRNHIPGWYPIRVKRTIRAYALRVRGLMADTDTAKARALMAEAGLRNLGMDAIGWLYAVMSGDKSSRRQLRTIRRYLSNRVSETAAAANFTTGYTDGAHLLLHSSRRADGIILEAMIKDQPKSKLIPKLVRGLLGHRKRGRWGNTQENSFVLLALDRYFNVYEKITPNFVARIWLGKQLAGEHTYRGRSTDRKHIDVPMAYMAKVQNADLVMSKRGKGRLYYRIGMTYAPTSLRLGPADHGFAVSRVYEAVDKPGDVTRRSDGVWVFKAGARVRVRLTMVAVNRRYHVALVDKLPAGLETLNPSLAVTGPVPQDPKTKKRGRYWWWSRPWYEHQNMRDERTEAFTSLLWQGVHNYTYVTRATTPGNFVVPPAKAEEMYHSETFGRSASDRVIIR